MVFQIRYQDQVTHVHCRFYIAMAPDRTYVLAGTFALKPEELQEFRKQCPKIEFRNSAEQSLRKGEKP